MADVPNPECVCGHRRADHPDDGPCKWNDDPRLGHAPHSDCDSFREKLTFIGNGSADFDPTYRDLRDWE